MRRSLGDAIKYLFQARNFDIHRVGNVENEVNTLIFEEKLGQETEVD